MGRDWLSYRSLLSLMNMGDPITAQMNRFYTEEFFAHVKQRLSSGGIFSFAVSGGESMLGPTQARFLGSIKKTLLQIFPKTLIFPGDQIRFFATDTSGELLSDYSVLANRIFKRNLQLTYIREDILQDALSPFRLDYLKSILARMTGKPIEDICPEVRGEAEPCVAGVLVSTQVDKLILRDQ